MKTIFRLFAGVIMLVLLFSAGAAEAKLKVVTTTPDLAAIAREIGKDRIEVVSLARGDQDMHFVEPRPSLVQQLRKADIFVKIGLDLDIWCQGLVDAARNSKIVYGAPGYVDASVGIPRLEIPTVRLDPSMGHIHIYGNPHYWLDPRNGKIIGSNILVALQRTSPREKDFFQSNYDDFCARLDKAVLRWQKAMQPYHGKQVVVYHKSWVYFNTCFGLREFDEIEPKPGIPPSPAHVHDLIGKMKAAGVKTILMETFYPKRFPQMIARETGADLFEMPTSVGARKDIRTYFDLFDYLVETMSSALQ